MSHPAAAHLPGAPVTLTGAGAGQAVPGYLPLQGRGVLVTGVSRRAGIGYAVACRAADLGASVFLHHYQPHDAAQPWGAEPLEPVLDGVRAHLRPGARLAHASADLAQDTAPAALVEQAAAALGGLEALVCNHASSGHDGRLEQVSAQDLDHHWRVNTRASLLAVKAFAALGPRVRQDPATGRRVAGGAVVLMTSGQLAGPMPEEIAYITSKAALAGATTSLADGLAQAGIRVNTVNPGPVNTGYMDAAAEQAVRSAFPLGQMPSPADPARLIVWLLTDDAAWVTGQVISTEGGFRR